MALPLRRLAPYGVVFLLLLLAATVYFVLAEEEQKIDFNADIRPILNKKCITCHGGVKRSGGFSLLFRTEALSPNESGHPAIVPGDVAASEMLRRINHPDPEERMPPESPPLPQAEIDLLTEWIEQGARWEDHWAYVKPEPIEPPMISIDSVDTGWKTNGIDRFVLRTLEENGMLPSEAAERATLLRRVSLDLTGLPPTPEEVRAFREDNSPEAYEKQVDRLLASPRYGERWAAMWMDLARYADSKGYEKDGHRSVWQYRDWLIRAFNDDMPFDQFTVEQLAGDLLPNPTDEQRIATAFHRNTMNNDEGGTDDEEFRVAAVIDRVNTTWDVWQATTMACVQCHSHPYDPIRHKEYYQFMAFFNNTADADVPSESPTLKTYTEEDQSALEDIKNWVIKHTSSNDDKLAQADDFVQLIKITEPKLHPASYDSVTNGSLQDSKFLNVTNGGFARIPNVTLRGRNHMFVSYSADRSTGYVEIRRDRVDGQLLGTWAVQKNEGGWNFETTSVPITPMEGTYDIFLVFRDKQSDKAVCLIEWVMFHAPLPGEDQPNYARASKQLFHLMNAPEGTTTTPVMSDRPTAYRRATHVFERGNWLVPGEAVEPGVPHAWNGMPPGASPDRLGMARWLVSEDNPLTARVAVNRFWSKLFGIGIVETVEDFGTQGFKPSHPELLDWLAQQFTYEHDWSIKKLLKQMVMSNTYRQRSTVSPELLERDPDNRLMARGPRVRLTAEQVRDQALAVGGLLSDKMYGPSVMPPQPAGLWQVVYSGMEWKTSEGEDSHRRALYTYWRRTSPYPSMMSFDTPSREFCVTRRIDTNTPLQALVMMNDTVYVEAARGLAQRVLGRDSLTVEEATDEASVSITPEEQIKTAYALALMQEISPEKLDALRALHEEAVRYYAEHPEEVPKLVGEENAELAALTVVASAIMNLDEFVTKG